MSINLDKVIQSLMQLISLAGVKFTGDDESLLLDALTRYHNDHSIVKSRKKADEILLQCDKHKEHTASCSLCAPYRVYFTLVRFRQTWSKPISLFSVSSDPFQAPK